MHHPLSGKTHHCRLRRWIHALSANICKEELTTKRCVTHSSTSAPTVNIDTEREAAEARRYMFSESPAGRNSDLELVTPSRRELYANVLADRLTTIATGFNLDQKQTYRCPPHISATQPFISHKALHSTGSCAEREISPLRKCCSSFPCDCCGDRPAAFLASPCAGREHLRR